MNVVGILGGGQLGRMLALAGHPLGVTCVVVDPAPDVPAAAVAEHVVGAYDEPACLEVLARRCDVVTYEFEQVPVAAVERLAGSCPVRPPARALAVGQDRLLEKRLFRDLGIATAPFVAVDTEADLARGLVEVGTPAVLKTRREGYDGKGQRVLRTPADAAVAFAALEGRPLLLEGWVDFARELSVLAVRDRSGAMAVYPVVENVHREGILRYSLAPAPDLTPALQQAAGAVARRVAEALDYVGVLAIELFDRDGTLAANELAPRVHNSGHWTIEGAETSQFENHLRAVLGLPLGATDAVGCSAMVNLIGEVPAPDAVLAIPGAHLHLYGKSARPGRKVGHVTVRAATADARDRGLAAVARLLPGTIGPE